MKFALILLPLLMVGCSTSIPLKTERAWLNSEPSKSLTRVPASDDTQSFKDDVVLVSDKCRLVVINMVSGELFDKEGSEFTAVCLMNGFKTKCSFYGSDQKQFDERDFIAAITGQEGVIGSQSMSDTFIVNVVTRKFYSTSNIVGDHGAVRGKKICSGHVFYKKELQDDEKQKGIKI